MQNIYKLPSLRTPMGDRSFLYDRMTLLQGMFEMKAAAHLLAQERRRARVAVVGIGGEVSSAHMPAGIEYESFGGAFQPFFLASLLEAGGIDYSMTLVDIRSDVLRMAAEQEEIRMRKSDWDCEGAHQDPFCKIAQAEFLLYARRCDLQPGEAGARIIDAAACTKNNESLQHAVEVQYAAIPRSFREKRATGDISFIAGDVSSVELGGHYDLIVCTNVLQYLNGRLMSVQEDVLPQNWREGMHPKRRVSGKEWTIPSSVAAAYNLVRHVGPGGYIVANYWPKGLPPLFIDDIAPELKAVNDPFYIRNLVLRKQSPDSASLVVPRVSPRV